MFFRLPHTLKTGLIWPVTPGVSQGWGEWQMVDLEWRCQGRGQAAHHHLPPPPGNHVSSNSPRSSGHDPEGVVSCRWSPSLSACAWGLKERGNRWDTGCFVSCNTQKALHTQLVRWRYSPTNKQVANPKWGWI